MRSLLDRLFDIAIAYGITLLFFAALYYRLYQRDPDSFLFSADIVASQRERPAAQFRHLEVEKELLATFRSAIESNTKPLPNGDKDQYRVGKVEFDVHNILQSSVRGMPKFELEILASDENHNILFSWTWGSSLNSHVSQQSDSLLRAIGALADQNQAALSDAQRQMVMINKDSKRIWSFWDFLYFSGITITTVGYGDILPNSTCIRLIVLSEVLVGVVIFVFALNIALAYPSNKKT
jgi:hypothetical protein